MTYPRVSHLSDNRQIANAINQALKLGESAGTGTGTGTVTTTGTPASGNLAKFSGSTSITNADLTGDVTTSGALATTIASGAVTLAKMANMATASLIYRKTTGAGAPEVNSLATLKTDLGLTGTNSGDQTITLTGDVTGSGTGSFAATLATSGVTAGTYTNATVTFDAKGRATSASSGTVAQVLIQEVVTSASQASVTFSSIPATYRDLLIVVRGRMTSAGVSNDIIGLQFNSDTGSNYNSERLQAFSTSNTGAQVVSQSSGNAGALPAATATASYAGVSHIRIGDYRGTTFFKQWVATFSASLGTGTFTQGAGLHGGSWVSTSAINAVKVIAGAGAFVDNTVVSLYGLM